MNEMVNEKNNEVIILVGMSGAGKSTLGKALAQTMGIGFLDLDDLLEEKLEMSITDFFAAKGEAAFRALEQQSVFDLKGIQKMVIATGGGALISPGVMSFFLELGTVFYLEASKELLTARLRNEQQQRPILKDLNEEQLQLRLSDLLDQRTPAYNRADFIIDAGKTVQEVAAAILMKL